MTSIVIGVAAAVVVSYILGSGYLIEKRVREIEKWITDLENSVSSLWHEIDTLQMELDNLNRPEELVQ